MIKEGVVNIDGEEYILWATLSDYQYGDLETAVHATRKRDFDVLMEKYKDSDGYIIPFSMFICSKDELEERIKEWQECK